MSQPFARHADGVQVHVRVSPRAGREGVEGIVTDGDGQVALKVAVSAPPEDGKANKAVIQVLAKAWRVPKSSISVVRGHTARHKTLLIQGDAAELSARLAEWLTAIL